MNVYTVEEIIDLGNHVLNICTTEQRAIELLSKYEAERILSLEVSAASQGRELALWQYAPKHEIYCYELED